MLVYILNLVRVKLLLYIKVSQSEGNCPTDGDFRKLGEIISKEAKGGEGNFKILDSRKIFYLAYYFTNFSLLLNV